MTAERRRSRTPARKKGSSSVRKRSASRKGEEEEDKPRQRPTTTKTENDETSERPTMVEAEDSINMVTASEDSSSNDEEEKETHLEAPTPGNIQEEGFIDAFYQPRSFSALLVLVLFVVYVTIYGEETYLKGTNRVKQGILMASCAFLLYCSIQLRDGHLLRPHPAIWRVAHGTGLLYFLLLVYLLCQDLQGVHTFLQLFDERVGVNEVEHSYGDDCRIYIVNHTHPPDDPWVNLRSQFWDRFTLAHFAGWAVKALILRDWGFMWVASVLFEVLEVTFQHMFPNFNECWWDHLILDIFGCNFLGMIVGMKMVEYLGTHQFDWTGQRMKRIPGSFGKVKRVFLQFYPYSFETYRWQVFSSWRRLAVGLSVMTILLLGELNGFFLKSVFNIPIDSDINLYRLTFWVFLTYMAVFEFFHYADGKSRRVGVNSWLAGSLVSLETLLVMKHAVQQKMFKKDQLPPAPYIVSGWKATAFLFVALGLVKVAHEIFDKPTRIKRVEKIRKLLPPKTGKILDDVSQLLTFALPVPLLIVLMIDCYRTMGDQSPPPIPGKDEGW